MAMVIDDDRTLCDACVEPCPNEAMAEVERIWGAPAGTPKGDRLDILATLIDAYESEHHPIDPPEPEGSDGPIASRRA